MRRAILSGVAAVAALVLPSSASSAVTIGSNLAATPTGGFTCANGCTASNAALPAASQASAGLVAPIDGVVVRWRIRVGYTATPVALRITRPGNSDSRTGAGTGPEVTPDAGSDYPISTFEARLPIQAGDAIGINAHGVEGLSANADTPGARFLVWGFSSNPLPLADGEAPRAGTSFNRELLLNADIEPDVDRDGLGDETQDQPDTTITKGAPNKTEKTTLKFKFRSDQPTATFECKLDKGSWKRCSSPKAVKRLDLGKHRFSVRAIDAAGNVDPTPARDKFRVVD